MTKYEFFGRENISEMQSKLTHILMNKYFNLWMDKFNWNGLTEDVKDQQERFIMTKLWSDGTVACRNVPRLDMLVFAPYSGKDINLYDQYSTVNLVSLHNASRVLIPTKSQVVDKDVVLIFAQPNHKPIKSTVEYYVERLVQIELVTNTNLQLHKIPFLISTTEDNKKQVQDIISKILNNEVAVFTGINDINSIQSVATNTPFIMDKLRSMYVSYENELLTYLGIDNAGSGEKKAQLLVDEVNSNNDCINAYGDAIYNEINKAVERINKVFNKQVSIENKSFVEPDTSDFESNDIVEEKEESKNDN